MISTRKYAKFTTHLLENDGTGYQSKRLKYNGYGKQNVTQILRLERGKTSQKRKLLPITKMAVWNYRDRKSSYRKREQQRFCRLSQLTSTTPD